MLLLELPAELFQKILVQAILARGVKRGLRLKLVCSKFVHLPKDIAQVTVGCRDFLPHGPACNL